MNLATWEETKRQDSKAKANQPANRTPSNTRPPPDNFAISDEARQKFTVTQGRDYRVQSARILVLTFVLPESATTPAVEQKRDLRFTVPLKPLGFMADGFAIRSYARKFRCVSAALGGFYIGSRHCNFFALPIVLAQSGCPRGWAGWSLRAYYID